MKKKELKNLAQKIAAAERVIENSNNKNEIYNAEQEIMRLSGSISSITDMMALDEMVQTILEKNS